MTMLEKALKYIPEDTWEDIIQEWLVRHPNPNSWIRIRGDSYSVSNIANDLNSKQISFVITNSIYLTLFISTGAVSDSDFSPEDFAIDPPGRYPEIHFESLPKRYHFPTSDIITRGYGVVCIAGVPIPVLEKLDKIGKFFED